MSQLDELLGRITKLQPEQKEEVRDSLIKATARYKFVPSPGPQTDAYLSKADVLLFGGEPGGGKSYLCAGLAVDCHERSLIMRRQYGDLDRIVEDVLKIHGSREGFNGSPPPKLKISENRIIDFAAANRVGDEQSQMGKGHDLIAIDEATHFAESQVRFVMGWLRTENPNQRCRVVMATNPPLTAEGLWVIKMFAPWLDPTHPKPAKPGELRWVISDEEGNDKWVDGPGNYPVGNKQVQALSRSYIPSSVRDNPYLMASGYEKQLDAMPEPYRSLLMGGFRTSFKDAPNQIIPTKWVQLAQERWTSTPPKGIPMCAMAIDASGGGDDPMVIAPRYDGWYAPLIEIPGKTIPVERAGAHCAGIVLSYRSHEALVIVDMGGGYGGPMYEQLIANGIEVKRYKGAESCSRRSRDGKLRFTNTRSAALWMFREALDPGQPGGSPIALPPNAKLISDLTAPTFDITPNGIRAETKEKVCERLGRSTDHGDATMMAWYEGSRMTSHATEWMDNTYDKHGRMTRTPIVISSGKQPLTAARKRA